MSRRLRLNTRNFKVDEGAHVLITVGDFVFLAGEYVLHKLECIEQTATGFRFRDLLTGEKFVYKTPVPYYTSGKPVFKNGLPAYPGDHKGMNIRWVKDAITARGQGRITELIKLHRELGTKSEVEIFFINLLIDTATEAIKALDFEQIKNGPEYWYRDALGRVFTVWRESINDFGGLVGAMDGSGLFIKDFLELNVERKARGSLSAAKMQAIQRAGKRGIEKALSFKR